MITNIKQLFVAGMVLFVIAAMLTACSNDDNTSDMDLGGNCLVEELVLNDQYKAIINTEKRQLKVKVPVDFTATEDMVITSLKVATGASTNYQVGDHLNLKVDKPLRVSNGGRTMDYYLNVRNDEAIMTKFVLEGVMGAIDQNTKTIEVSVLANSGINLANATFEVECSEDAICNPVSGMKGNFTAPFQITLTDNTATNTYTVNVKIIKNHIAIFVSDGDASTIENLNNEEKAAAKWFTSNIAGAAFVSWNDITSGNISLDDCKFVFFFRHCAAYSSYNNFKSGEPKAMAAIATMKGLWEKGVGFVLGRSAVNYGIALGAQLENSYPNNVWGGGGDGTDGEGEGPLKVPGERVEGKGHGVDRGLLRAQRLRPDGREQAPRGRAGGRGPQRDGQHLGRAAHPHDDGVRRIDREQDTRPRGKRRLPQEQERELHNALCEGLHARCLLRGARARRPASAHFDAGRTRRRRSLARVDIPRLHDARHLLPLRARHKRPARLFRRARRGERPGHTHKGLELS